MHKLFAASAAGRVDAQVPDATGRLPAEDFSADQLKQAFRQQGLSVQEFIALAGAHTVSFVLANTCSDANVSLIVNCVWSVLQCLLGHT